MLRDLRRTRTLLAVLVLLSFLLITLDYRRGRGVPLDAVRRGVAGVLGPIEAGVAAVGRPISAGFGAVTDRGGARNRADLLARDNTALRQQLAQAREQPTAGAAGALTAAATAGRYRLVPARVVALGGGLNRSWTATIDAGSRDGLRPDIAVLNGAGLVGRVTRVTATTATVLLAADPASRVGVRISGSGQIGVVKGQGAGSLVLELLDVNARMKVGQTVSTFGSLGGRPYAGGIPVGRVTAIFPGPGTTTRTALVTPHVSFTSLDLVGVVVGSATRPARRATLPPKTEPNPVVSPPLPARQGTGAAG